MCMHTLKIPLKTFTLEIRAAKDLTFVVDGLSGDMDRTATLVSLVNHTLGVTMGKRCVAAGCSSIHKNGVYHYTFPKNQGRSSKKDQGQVGAN